MLSVDEALDLVLKHARPLPVRAVPLDDALSLTLAEDVASDIDSPPYDKSIVDGYAIRAEDMASGVAELRVLEEVVAGAVPSHLVESGTATRIMTGAPIPVGANAVVMIEQSELFDRDGVTSVRLTSAAPKTGQSIMPRGSSMHRGDVVLNVNHTLNSVAIGLLAELGRTQVVVRPLPSVAVLATGNELVPPDQTPGPGQIRNSNESMLAALVRSHARDVRRLGIARDDRDDLRRSITEGLEADVLLLSGGVSAGVLDLVPSVLEELGVRQVFHKVQLKPGKPLWFGVYEPDDHRTLVFGLPGNPVSTLVCYHLFVRWALERLRGRGEASTGLTPKQLRIKARLTEEFVHQGERPTYYPARIGYIKEEKRLVVTPLRYRGSGDLRALVDATCLIAFPPGDKTYRVGKKVKAIGLHWIGPA